MRNLIHRFWKGHRGLIIFAFLMITFRSAIADWNVVPTGSMLPTIVEGDRIAVNKLAYDLHIPFTHVSLYRFADPERGDIVIFDSAAADKRLVKRVIGLPGDTVALQNNQLVINGEPQKLQLSEIHQDHLLCTEKLGELSYLVKIQTTSANGMNTFGEIQVPEGHYLVMGDNRDNSADSRVYGFVPRNEIVGRSSKVIVSLDYENYYLPRGERFLRDL